MHSRHVMCNECNVILPMCWKYQLSNTNYTMENGQNHYLVWLQWHSTTAFFPSFNKTILCLFLFSSYFYRFIKTHFPFMCWIMPRKSRKWSKDEHQHTLLPHTQPSTLLLLHTPHPLTPTLSLGWSALSLSGLVMRSEQCAGVLLWMLEWTGAGVKCWSSHRATSTLKTSPVTISRVQELEVIYTGLNNLAWTLTLLHEVNFDNLF